MISERLVIDTENIKIKSTNSDGNYWSTLLTRNVRLCLNCLFAYEYSVFTIPAHLGAHLHFADERCLVFCL